MCGMREGAACHAAVSSQQPCAAVMSASSNFRKAFVLKAPLKKWFPGHMISGMRRMQNKLTEMDCLIEVHDARIPLSGRNPSLRETLLGAKPHILLLNKKDLVDDSFNEIVVSKLQHQGIDKTIYSNLLAERQGNSGFNQVLPTILDVVRRTDRYNRSDKPEINVMVIGIPNVGKSCLINKVRALYRSGKKAPAQVGGIAGVTRSVMERIKLSVDPLVYILDTPGILEPKVSNVEQYMKLALCSSLCDQVIGIEAIADYALFWLNKHRNFEYIKYFDLECDPSDCIEEILYRIAVKKSLLLKYKDLKERKVLNRPNLEAAASVFVKAFRIGEFGKVMLDTDLLKKKSVITSNDITPFAVDLKYSGKST